jgi:hypothetical protein
MDGNEEMEGILNDSDGIEGRESKTRGVEKGTQRPPKSLSMLNFLRLRPTSMVWTYCVGVPLRLTVRFHTLIL